MQISYTNQRTVVNRFEDLKAGEVFKSQNFIYMKIVGNSCSAVNLETGSRKGFRPSSYITKINATLQIERERA